MADKRNNIVEEQRKARQEFLKLKRMQQEGAMPQEKTEPVAPKTFKEKLAHFWYYYKVQTIFVFFLVVVITFTTVQCVTREKYDITIMYFAFTTAAPAQIEKAEAYFEKFAEDTDGNGEVNVKIINCSFDSALSDMNYRHASFSKVQSVIITEESTVVFMIDQAAKEYFENALDYSLFDGDLIKMNEEFYKQTSFEMEINGKTERVTFPEGLMLGLRIIDGTAFEGKEDALAAFETGEKLYNQIKKQSS